VQGANGRATVRESQFGPEGRSGRRDPLIPAPVLVQRRTRSQSTPDTRRTYARFRGGPPARGGNGPSRALRAKGHPRAAKRPQSANKQSRGTVPGARHCCTPRAGVHDRAFPRPRGPSGGCHVAARRRAAG
jgi:hypothetical protein